eukprot:7996940-Alexandrium_andersonii.AAC.1
MVHIPPPLDLLRSLCLFPEPAKARPGHTAQRANAASPPARALLAPPSIHAACSYDAAKRAWIHAHCGCLRPGAA